MIIMMMIALVKSNYLNFVRNLMIAVDEFLWLAVYSIIHKNLYNQAKLPSVFYSARMLFVSSPLCDAHPLVLGDLRHILAIAFFHGEENGNNGVCPSGTKFLKN